MEPSQLHSLFVEAFNAADIESLLNLYEEDAVLWINGRQLAGRAAIRDTMERFVSAGGGMTMETRLALETGDGLALLHGAWAMGPVQGLSTEIARRQPDGSWLWVVDNPFTPER